jgi:hypothetical protein
MLAPWEIIEQLHLHGNGTQAGIDPEGAMVTLDLIRDPLQKSSAIVDVARALVEVKDSVSARRVIEHSTHSLRAPSVIRQIAFLDARLGSADTTKKWLTDLQGKTKVYAQLGMVEGILAHLDAQMVEE